VTGEKWKSCVHTLGESRKYIESIKNITIFITGVKTGTRCQPKCLKEILTRQLKMVCDVTMETQKD
jgi:hypothetical protein